jgi:hypothetical protein
MLLASAKSVFSRGFDVGGVSWPYGLALSGRDTGLMRTLVSIEIAQKVVGRAASLVSLYRQRAIEWLLTILWRAELKFSIPFDFLGNEHSVDKVFLVETRDNHARSSLLAVTFDAGSRR